MEGWIICRKPDETIYSEAYEIDRFVEEAKKENINLKVVSPKEIDLIILKGNKNNIFLNGKPTTLPDFIIPRSGSETNYFNLAVLRQFEKLGIYILNSSQCIGITKDKLHTHQLLAKNNLPVPKTMLANFPINFDLVSKYIGYPIIIKTISGSHGSGVFLSENKKNFKDLTFFLQSTNKDINLILQEFIAHSKGHDLRVITIGKKIIACMHRQAIKGHFKANFSIGGKVSEYKTNSEIIQLATKTQQLLQLDMSGIDLLFGKDQFYICEVNSAPGFRGLESCCNINIPKEIFKFIKTKLRTCNEM